MINQRETVIIQSPEQGASSRKRVPLIEQAISQLEDSRKYNRYAICEQLAEIMINKYKGNNLDYQSRRMGMATTKEMLQAIDVYFYKHFKAK